MRPLWVLEHLSFSRSSNICELSSGRLFNFQGGVYAGHWVKFGWSTADVPSQHKCWSDGWGDRHSCEYTAISRLDFTTNKLKLVHQFHVPILGHTYRYTSGALSVRDADCLHCVHSQTLSLCSPEHVLSAVSSSIIQPTLICNGMADRTCWS